MTNDKKFYWLKLKKDFFHQHQLKVLKSLPNGRLYALIYLELMAESTSHNGELRYSQMLPYDTVTLSAVIDEDKDNVEKAIETLERLEMVEILDDGTIYLNEVKRLVGSAADNDNANRQRRYREKQKALCYEGVTKNNESIEIRDKSKENRLLGKKFTPPTLEEVKAYCDERGNGVDYQKFYDYYSIAEWKDSKGNPVKNWKQKMIANWEKDKPATKADVPVYNTDKNRKLTDEELQDLLNLRKE